MPAAISKRNDHGMIVRPVAVGSDKEIQDLQVVIRGRERQSKSSLRRRQSSQEIHRQKQRGDQAIIEIPGAGGRHEALRIGASEGTYTSSRIQTRKLVFKPRFVRDRSSGPDLRRYRVKRLRKGTSRCGVLEIDRSRIVVHVVEQVAPQLPY